MAYAENTTVSVEKSLAEIEDKFADPSYRHSYVVAHTRHSLARQMREMRGDLTQTKFGAKIGMKQCVVARLENPSYGRWALSTLFAIARQLDCAVFVRFVSFQDFIMLTRDQSDEAATATSNLIASQQSRIAELEADRPLSSYGYSELFNAIAAATSVYAGGIGINVSVAAFLAALKGEPKS